MNKKKQKESNTSTPYDDVHRTMLNDCPKLIIPVVNEMFHKKHSDNEKITLLNNDLFVNRQNGKQVERITDTNLLIGSIRYHLECQSTADGTIMYRIFEYDSQIAFFEKNLLFLIPFHIFSYKQYFDEYETNEYKLKELKHVYEEIIDKLSEYAREHIIDEYTKSMIIDMSKKILEHLAKKYSNVKEGVGAVMGGKILDYEAKGILNKGRAVGIIRTARKYNASDEDIIEQLVSELTINENAAREYLRNIPV